MKLPEKGRGPFSGRIGDRKAPVFCKKSVRGFSTPL